MQCLRFTIVALAAFIVSLSPLFVLPAGAAVDSASAKYVETLGNQALSVIANKALSKAQKQTSLEKLFADSVDIPWVGRFVMGRFWRQATDDQKTRYLKQYERFLLKHYTSRFTDYTSGTFKITAAKEDEGGEYTVSMQLASDSNPEPVLIDYRLRKNGGGFKIFDVIVEGVSLITTQRSEFSSVMNTKGIDALIGQLETKSDTVISNK